MTEEKIKDTTAQTHTPSAMRHKIKKEDFKPCLCCEVRHNKKLMIEGLCWRCKAHKQKTAKAIFDNAAETFEKIVSKHWFQEYVDFLAVKEEFKRELKKE